MKLRRYGLLRRKRRRARRKLRNLIRMTLIGFKRRLGLGGLSGLLTRPESLLLVARVSLKMVTKRSLRSSSTNLRIPIGVSLM